MLENEKHKKLLDKLDKSIDPEHVKATEQLHEDMFNGKPLPYLPCVMGLGKCDDWPQYTFTQAWDDVEKNLMNSLRMVYCGALIKDDRLYQIRPEYGVVNIPETFGIKSIITDQGNSMSEGLNDIEQIKALIDKGVPDFSDKHTAKVKEYYNLAKEVFGEYENLSKYIHFTLPDTQGPFDLACLIWGYNIMYDLYENTELVEKMLDLVTDTFVKYNSFFKEITEEPTDSAYHICGLKLVKGGVRICDDSATLISPEFYSKYIVPRNLKAFEPFDGGWLHYCGNGNHIVDSILDMKPVKYLHLGNPDDHDFLSIVRKTSERKVVLYWSGALELAGQAQEIAGNSRLLVLAENRYAPKDLEDAKYRLAKVRNSEAVQKASW